MLSCFYISLLSKPSVLLPPVHIFQTNIVFAPVGIGHVILFNVVIVSQSSFNSSVFIVCLDLPTTILDIIVLVAFVILQFFFVFFAWFFHVLFELFIIVILLVFSAISSFNCGRSNRLHSHLLPTTSSQISIDGTIKFILCIANPLRDQDAPLSSRQFIFVHVIPHVSIFLLVKTLLVCVTGEYLHSLRYTCIHNLPEIGRICETVPHSRGHLLQKLCFGHPFNRKLGIFPSIINKHQHLNDTPFQLG